MITATGLLDGHAYFLHWGIVQISLANLIVILSMLVVFALAVVIPLPQGHKGDEPEQVSHDAHN